MSLFPCCGKWAVEINRMTGGRKNKLKSKRDRRWQGSNHHPKGWFKLYIGQRSSQSLWIGKVVNTGRDEDNSLGAMCGVGGLYSRLHDFSGCHRSDIFKKMLKGMEEGKTTEKPKFKVRDHWFVLTSPRVSWFSPALSSCTCAGKRWTDTQVGYLWAIMTERHRSPEGLGSLPWRGGTVFLEEKRDVIFLKEKWVLTKRSRTHFV